MAKKDIERKIALIFATDVDGGYMVSHMLVAVYYILGKPME